MAEDITIWRGIPVVPLDENEPLHSGDRIVIRFKWFLDGGTYIKAAQLDAIDKKLSGRSDFRIVGYVDQGEYLDAEILVLQGVDNLDPSNGITQASLAVSTGVVVTALAISIAITTVVYSLLKYKQYKLIESGVLPPTTSSLSEVKGGLHVLVYVGAVLGLLYVFRNLLQGKKSYYE
jgi:hypothetical protein